MPRRDGTGPMGMGAMTGKGLGVCTGENAPVYGRGFKRGCGRGFGRGNGRGLGLGANANWSQTDSKQRLQERKEQLMTMLDAVNKRLENL